MRAAVFLSILFTIIFLTAEACAQSAPAVRLALVGFNGNAAALTARAITTGVTGEARVTAVDPALVDLAVKGIHYDGSMNLKVDEARRLGSAIGCDFFIIGKAELVPRSEAGKKTYVEAMIGIFIVDARGGSLVRFDFIVHRAETEDGAAREAASDLEHRIPGYLDELIRWADSRNKILSKGVEVESIEDIPEPTSSRNGGFSAPVFTNRVRPVYTDEADRADISATVEARAVLQSNGEIGSVEIMKWAGYGLDDAAIQAIKQLKFTPATRGGKPISVRALIQYNFRRSRGPEPITTEEKKPQPPERDLRQIFKPKIRPPALRPV